MAPSAVSPLSPAQHGGNDTDLTKIALDKKLEKNEADYFPEPTNATDLKTQTADAVAAPAAVAELDASKLVYNLSTNLRDMPTLAAAAASTETICTDHMICINWHVEKGWSVPELKPYGPLSLMPTASVLHYATECFEGLKAYRGHDGKLRLFRPDCNAKRMLMSSTRISLPAFAPAELEKLIIALMSVDGPRWLPRDRPGDFLYIRPTIIGTQAQLGVQTPREAMMFITACIMQPMDSPLGGAKLHTSPEDMVRAWVGGFGYAKVGASYGPSLLATAEARKRGYHQILWLYGPEAYCTEAGASNFFVVIKEKTTGKVQLITAPLDDRLILDGVTRRSVVQLARERLADEVEVVERRYTIDEVMEAHREGRLVESFASGTAYFVCPISLIHHRGEDVHCGMGAGQGGKYTIEIKKWLKDIMYGAEDHPWGVVVPEEV